MKRMVVVLAALTTMFAMLLAGAPAQASPTSPTVNTALHQEVTAVRLSELSDSNAAVAAAAKRCASGWFCVWPKVNFKGKANGGTKPGVCYTPFKPAGHSVSNQTGRTIRVYAKAHCKGSHFDLRTGHYSNPTPFGVRSVTIR